MNSKDYVVYVNLYKKDNNKEYNQGELIRVINIHCYSNIKEAKIGAYALYTGVREMTNKNKYVLSYGIKRNGVII